MEVINEGILKALEMLGLSQPQQGGGVLSAVAGMPRPEGKPSAPVLNRELLKDQLYPLKQVVKKTRTFLPGVLLKVLHLVRHR